MQTQDQYIGQLAIICAQKLQTLNSHQLAYTTQTILQNLLNQDHVTITNHQDLLTIPQTILNAHPSSTTPTIQLQSQSGNHYQLLKLLACLIITKHYTELTHLYDTSASNGPISLGLTLHLPLPYSPETSITTQRDTGRAKFTFTRNCHNQMITQRFPSSDNLINLLEYSYPLFNPHPQPLPKILKDLILLDKHDLKTIEDYSTSQHAFVLTNLLECFHQQYFTDILIHNHKERGLTPQLESDTMVLLINQCLSAHEEPLDSSSTRSIVDQNFTSDSWRLPDTSGSITLRGSFLDQLIATAEATLPVSPHKDLLSSKVKSSSTMNDYDFPVDTIIPLDNLIIPNPSHEYQFVDADVLSTTDFDGIFSWLSMSGLDQQSLGNRLDSLNKRTGLLTKMLCKWSYESLPVLENKNLFKNTVQKMEAEDYHDYRNDLFKALLIEENDFYTEQMNHNDPFAMSRFRRNFGGVIDRGLANGYSVLFSESNDTPTPSSIVELEARIASFRELTEEGVVPSGDGLVQLLHNVYLAPCGYDSYEAIKNHWESGDLDIVDVALMVLVKLIFTKTIEKTLADSMTIEVINKFTELAVDVCYDWYDSDIKGSSKSLFHEDLEADGLFYEMHSALTSTVSGLKLTEAFRKIDDVIWSYIKDLLVMRICASNETPVDFIRENLILDFQNRLNDKILGAELNND